MKKINFLFLLITLIIPYKAIALIEVDITRGNLNPLPIAVSALYTDKDTNDALKRENLLGSKVSYQLAKNNEEYADKANQFSDNSIDFCLVKSISAC